MRIIGSRERGFKRTIDAIVGRGAHDADQVESAVVGILDDVRRSGDRAVLKYTKKFDAIDLRTGSIPVAAAEVRKAYRSVKKADLDLFESAAARIRSFHEKQMPRSWFDTEPDGSVMGQLVTPLERVGLYVPGGKASYPSSVLMNAIPAQVAGVDSLAICTPAPGGVLNPHVLVAADMLGIEEIYRIGGAQAVGALAYGTATVAPVDKIVGPGNIYVATAKKIVYGEVDIDMVAGPSEILIIADGSADPEHLAADLLSQAEHDEMALCVLLTDSGDLAAQVQNAVEEQLDALPGKGGRAREALGRQGYLIVLSSLQEAFRLSNAIAPEHLEIATDRPFEALPFIRNAGSIFLGHNTPEPMGDYMAGPNHVLPTGGTARFFSTLGVESFLKRSNILHCSVQGLGTWGGKVARFARLEGLEAHARSVLARKKQR